MAQSERYEGRRIGRIEFGPEDKLLAADEFEDAVSPLRAGEPLRMAYVREVIERLYASGAYEDVWVDAQMDGENVVLVFHTRAATFIRNVTVQGVEEPPSAGQLVNATKLELGTRFEPAQLQQSVENLLETLRSNGFYLAKITPETVAQPFQQVDISFRVDTGDRAKYSPPTIRGNPQKPVEEIYKATHWRRLFGILGWKEVTERRTNQGLDRIRRSYQKRNFLMTRVVLDQMEFRPAENRVVPSLTIDSGPRVIIRTKGEKISRGRLRELVPVYQELTVDRDLLVEGKRELTEYMQARGYFEAQIDFDIVSSAPGETVVEYAFAPGDRHKLVHVGIGGNVYFDTATLRERMYIMTASLLRFRHGRFSQDFLRRDANSIKALYQTNGFRDVDVVTRVEDDYLGKLNQVAVFFDVKEGPQWFVSDLSIEGVDDITAEDVFSILQSTPGQPFSDLSVATDQESVLSYFFNNGYPDATLEVTATPASEAHRMNLRYLIQPGNRQFVRDVLISGLNATDPALVRERIDLVAGDPLSQTSIIESQRRLYDLGIFARVDAALQNPDGDTDHKFVLYRFEEAKKISLTGGIGAQIARIGRGSPSLDVPAGSPGFSPRLSLGVSRSNFLGLGHTLSFQSRFSNIQRRGLISYLAPQFKGNDDLSLTFTGLFDDSRDVQTFNSRRWEGSVQLAQRMTKANTGQYRISYRRVTISDLKITPSLVPLFSQAIKLGTISGTFLQDRRDDPIDAKRGVYNTVDMALASNFFGEPRTTFGRVLARNSTYHRLGREMVFARSTSFGFLSRIAGEDVPLPERFFAGGVASHRGFPENQAGPRDLLTGFPLGGKTLLVSNHELRFPLLGDNVGGVWFHDMGNVYSSFRKFTLRSTQRGITDFDYLTHAVGFGIRYRTPIGPIRVDLAYGINNPRFMGLKGRFEDLLDPELPNVQRVEQRISRFQFHFSLGQLF